MRRENIEWLFPTPIVEYDLTEYLTTNVARALQNTQKSRNGLVDGIRATQDPSQLPECFTLYKVFQSCVDEYSKVLGINKSTIFESWMNVLIKGGSVSVHRHYGSIISAAFYPYVEDNSSNLVFVNPMDGFRMMDVNEACLDCNGEYTSNIKAIKPRTGKLVLFPSWIQHYVPPNKSNLRVTLSFNTRIIT